MEKSLFFMFLVTETIFGVTYKDQNDIRKHKNVPLQITAVRSKNILNKFESPYQCHKLKVMNY